MQLSIIIVNYNVKYYLEQCLRSVQRASKGISTEVIVVDNCSTDGSMPYLRERFPEVHFIENKENAGFARANNQAFELAKGKYVLMLNPDTMVTKEALHRCVEFMDEHSEAGAVGVKMINKDGTFAMESRRGIVSPWVSFCKATGLCRRYPESKLFGHYYMSYLDKEEVNAIEMVSGAYMMLRKSTLEKVGTLDEQFFMYWEDSDLSYRILKAGYKNYYLPSPIFHYKGESSVKSVLRYRYWLYHSLQLFFKKHAPVYNIISYIPLKLIVLLLKFRIHHVNPVIHGKDWDKWPDIKKRYIVLGSKQAHDEIKQIFTSNDIEDKNLYILANEKDCPTGHLTIENTCGEYNHVLYDCDSYSYDSVIKLLQATPENNLQLATYSTETKKLITADAIYEFK